MGCFFRALLRDRSEPTTGSIQHLDALGVMSFRRVFEKHFIT